MASRGTFLAPVLLPLPSCFINLPRAFVQTFLSGPDLAAGSTILELSWETMDGYVQRVCVGWIGGIARDSDMRSDLFEVSAEFARCVGLQEHLLRAPQSFIGVHVVDMLPFARQVNVDPCTPDDWELIQLHAGLMETEFLRQICVVNDQQIHPILVHQNVVIRIRVSLPVGMEFARLSPNTEVIVAPKERKPLAKSTTLDPAFYYAASPVLKVQEPLRTVTIPADEVWVHPETLAALDGALESDAGQARLTAPIVAIWKDKEEAASSTRGTESASNVADTTTTTASQSIGCGVVRLKCSPQVARGRVMVSHATASSMALSSRASIHLRVLRLPKYPVIALRIKATSDALASVARDESISSFIAAIDARSEVTVIHDGSILEMKTPNGHSAAFVGEVDFESDPVLDELETQAEDLPTGALAKYTLLGGRNGLNPRSIRIDCAVASPPQQHRLHTFQQRMAPSDAYAGALQRLARSAPAYKLALESVSTILFRDEALARVMLGVKPPGSVLLHGDRGSGKSTILAALGDELANDPKSAATPVLLECRTLRGLKMEAVKSRLTAAFDDARSRAPSVVLLDNLDALIPQEEDQAGPSNEQSRRIAEHLVTLLETTRTRMWNTTLELGNRVNHELQELANKRTQQQFLGAEDVELGARSLVETAGEAMLHKSVAVIAVSRSAESVHKTLRCTGLFDRLHQVMAPNAEQREFIIRDLLLLKLRTATHSSVEQVVLDPAIDMSLLSSLTEGYSLRDLTNVSDRALHQLFLRLAKERQAMDTDGMVMTQTDFTQALDGFQPTALVGVDLFKSSIHWDDVGGLSTVRNVLKDTLELPTRYSKLYDQAPIKLPAGMMLYGPPGCGKTLLASAVASECGLNFISVKGPEVLNKYIGASEQAIRDLFGRAASAAPSVLFLDEFDSIAPRRGADNTGVTDRLVNQLLTFLDGVESRKGVYVLAATSRPDMIDPALLRPGRLDKSLYCGFPDAEERLDILRAVGRHMELSEDASAYLTDIAQAVKSRLFSGADLQAIMYSAQLELVHEKLGSNPTKSNVISRSHLETAFKNAKPSTSEAARRQFDSMYASFSKSRVTDFSVAAADASANADGLKAHAQHQRTALA